MKLFGLKEYVQIFKHVHVVDFDRARILVLSSQTTFKIRTIFYIRSIHDATTSSICLGCVLHVTTAQLPLAGDAINVDYIEKSVSIT